MRSLKIDLIYVSTPGEVSYAISIHDIIHHIPSRLIYKSQNPHQCHKTNTNHHPNMLDTSSITRRLLLRNSRSHRTRRRTYTRTARIPTRAAPSTSGIRTTKPATGAFTRSTRRARHPRHGGCDYRSPVGCECCRGRRRAGSCVAVAVCLAAAPVVDGRAGIETRWADVYAGCC